MIFPNIVAKKQDKVNLGNLKELAWDFISDTPIIHNNELVVVSGLDALRVWIYKTLRTRRYKYITYSNSYGISIHSIIGKIYNDDIKRSIKKEIIDALLVNDYIDRVNIVNLSFNESGLSVNLDVVAKGGLQLQVNVDV